MFADPVFCSVVVIMQGERKDRSDWVLFPENKSFAPAASVFLSM